MARGKIPQEAKMRRQVPLEELVDWLLPETETWTWEEAAMSMPYSNVRGWIKILRLQRRLDKRTFQGPPGLSKRMEVRWLSTMEREMTSNPLTWLTQTAKMSAG
jgi:hypothetical protein